MDILTEASPAGPKPQQYSGAYLPGVVPGAAFGQYGAPLAAPGGPAVVFGPGHYDTPSRSPLDRGSGAISGRAVSDGNAHLGTANGG